MYTSYHGECLKGKYVDEVLRGYFPNYDYKGVFIDIGAFEPIKISNSHHFHKNGWKVYAIEANPDNIPLLKEHREYVYNVAVADTNRDSVEFHVVSNGEWTAGFSAITISEDYKRIFPGGIKSITKITVPQRTLNSLLENEMADVTLIDIMSLDIEGGELNCLKGFDIDKYLPHVIVIENVTDDAAIDDYLTQHGYICDQRIQYNHYWVNKHWYTTHSS